MFEMTFVLVNVYTIIWYPYRISLSSIANMYKVHVKQAVVVMEETCIDELSRNKQPVTDTQTL